MQVNLERQTCLLKLIGFFCLFFRAVESLNGIDFQGSAIRVSGVYSLTATSVPQIRIDVIGYLTP